MGATIMDLPNEILIKIVKVIKDNHLITLSSINNRFRTLIFETREFNDRLVLVFKDNQWRNSDKIQAFKQMAANGRKFNQIEILNIESTTDFHRKGFNEIKDLFKDFFKNPDHVKSLTINNCKYVEWMDMMHFLNFFPRLEIVEMGENKFWNEAMSYPDAALWRRMYRSFAMESFPLASSNAPAFEHLKVLRLYNRPSFQYTNIFQNAINLEDLETDCSQCFFVFRFNNLKRLKIQITQLSDNFFSDLVLDKIQFSLTHFSVGGNFEYKRVAFKDNISLFLVRQQNITDLTFEMKEIPDLVLLDIVKLPNLKRLKV